MTDHDQIGAWHGRGAWNDPQPDGVYSCSIADSVGLTPASTALKARLAAAESALKWIRAHAALSAGEVGYGRLVEGIKQNFERIGRAAGEALND